MAYGDFKDIKRRTFSDKIFRYKAFNIAKIPKSDGYQRGLASIVYKVFDKKSSGVVLIMRSNKISNYLMNFINQLLEIFKKEKCILHLEIIFGVLI